MSPKAKSPPPSTKTPSSLKIKPTQQRSAFTYALFLHREELRKCRASSMRTSRTKLLLTHELITKTAKNISKCSADDLQILSRETIFKKNLHRQIVRQRYCQHMEMLRQRKQKKETKAQENNRQQTRPHNQHLYIAPNSRAARLVKLAMVTENVPTS